MKSVLKLILQFIQRAILIFSYSIARREKNKKIIIGVTEIANVLFNMKQLFSEGCVIVCKNRNPFYENNNYDIDISNKKYATHFIAPFVLGKLAKNARFFIYLWCDGFLYNRELDFRFLKSHNIPIICCFLGDDIRSRKRFLNYCNSINFNTYVEYDNPSLYLSNIYDNKKKALAEQADKYASIIFSYKFDQYSYLESGQYFFPPVINETFFFNFEKFSNRPLRIVHAPSSPVSKGTPIVRSVIKQLKHEGYDFQYIELIYVSNETVIRELNQSHIVLNQFYSLITGIFGLEAMATGNAVLMSAKSEHYPYHFNNAWLETEDWQLYGNLKCLLDNPDKIIEYAKNGYDYITKNFSRDAVLNSIRSVFLKNGVVFDDVNRNAP
ncbi:MAG: hypothetical protein LBE13_06570 [Bacteroidales bacterium]|nr:hypothetical protein [Bacteroidales bacterium]